MANEQQLKDRHIIVLRRYRQLPRALLISYLVLLLGSVASAKEDARQPANKAEALALVQQIIAARDDAQLAQLEQEQTPFEREWGIKLLGLRITAGGYAIDFRYKVLDPEKAAPLLHRGYQLTPFLLVEETGARLGVPFTEKAGSLKSSVTSESQIRRGKNYSALFANPGQHVAAGDEVTVIIGDFMVENVVVQ